MIHSPTLHEITESNEMSGRRTLYRTRCKCGKWKSRVCGTPSEARALFAAHSDEARRA